MQCKDIKDTPIIEFVNKHGGIGCTWFNDNPRSVRHVMPKMIHDKLILAKMRKLIKRKLIKGCACGCRGYFEITGKGKDFINDDWADI